MDEMMLGLRLCSLCKRLSQRLMHCTGRISFRKLSKRGNWRNLGGGGGGGGGSKKFPRGCSPPGPPNETLTGNTTILPSHITDHLPHLHEEASDMGFSLALPHCQ